MGWQERVDAVVVTGLGVVGIAACLIFYRSIAPDPANIRHTRNLYTRQFTPDGESLFTGTWAVFPDEGRAVLTLHGRTWGDPRCPKRIELRTPAGEVYLACDVVFLDAPAVPLPRHLYEGTCEAVRGETLPDFREEEGPPILDRLTAHAVVGPCEVFDGTGGYDSRPFDGQTVAAGSLHGRPRLLVPAAISRPPRWD